MEMSLLEKIERDVAYGHGSIAEQIQALVEEGYDQRRVEYLYNCVLLGDDSVDGSEDFCDYPEEPDVPEDFPEEYVDGELPF